MDAKIKLVLPLLRGLIPPISKESLIHIQEPKHELSKVILSYLEQYKDKMRIESQDLYSIVLTITCHFIITYESDEKMREKVDSSIDSIIEDYLKRKGISPIRELC